MALSNDIVLRPRFKLSINQDKGSIFHKFDVAKLSQSHYIVNREDPYVFIQLPREKQHYWSPQLQLKVDEKTPNNSTVKGIFGPSPAVWSLFMFLHFLVAGLFIAFGIWAYLKWQRGQDFQMQLYVMGSMVVLWFVLYFAGRIGKRTGKHQMQELNQFVVNMLDT